MLGDIGAQRVYLASGVTDMRKSIDGLAAIVQTSFGLDPFGDCWFVFCNRDRDKLKILHWDTNGFWLYYKRLERGRFKWPDTKGREPIAVTRRELSWLLSGLTLEQKQAHKPVLARAVA